jgi:hypothetical protein
MEVRCKVRCSLHLHIVVGLCWNRAGDFTLQISEHCSLKLMWCVHAEQFAEQSRRIVGMDIAPKPQVVASIVDSRCHHSACVQQIHVMQPDKFLAHSDDKIRLSSLDRNSKINLWTWDTQECEK